MRHQYLVTEPLDPAVAAEATDRPRSRLTSTTSAAEAGRAARRRLLARPGHLGHRRAAGRAADAVRRRHGPLRRVVGGRPASASRRCATLEIAKVVNGPEAFTPDGEFILGETPRSTGLWVAAGFCVHGLAGAGGVGRVMAEWIVEGHALRRRLGDGHPPLRRSLRVSRSYAPRRARSTPTRATTTSSTRTRSARRAGRCGCRRPTRGCARSTPSSARRRAGSASTGSSSNAARRRRVAAAATAGPGRNWSPAIGAECVATRDAAGLFDQSSFAKLDVSGPGAPARSAGSAPTRSTSRSGPPSTPSCSTSAAGSRPT